MNCPKFAALLTTLCSLALLDGSAGEFTNLNFESTTIVNGGPDYPPYYGHVPMTNALPYWQGSGYGKRLGPTDLVFCDMFSLGDYTVGIVNSSAINGKCSAFMQHNEYAQSELWQTGAIPAVAKSVRFKTKDHTSADHLAMSFNRQAVPICPVSQDTNFVEWAADISPYAGQTAEMMFVCRMLYSRTNTPPGSLNSHIYGTVVLDDIYFSPEPVVAVIRKGPAPQQTFWGGTAKFEVTSWDETASYQWLFNGEPLAGATARTLQLTNVQWGQEGLYSVIVSNDQAAVRSAEARLEVGSIASWRSDGRTDGIQQAPPLKGVAAIASGGRNGLALLTNGLVVSWGLGSADQPSWLSNVVAIAANDNRSVALRSDGSRVLWGGWLPRPPAVATNVVAIAPGLDLKANGKVAAWDPDSQAGSVGNVPATLNGVVAISGSQTHALALKTNGTVVAWGNNAYGQSTVPAGLSNVVAVCAGVYISVVLKADGSALLWGYTNNIQPVPLTNVVALAAGFFSAMALQDDSSVVFLGQGLPPEGLRNVTAISINGGLNMALVSDKPLPVRAAFEDPKISPAGFTVAVPTRSGRVYRLEYSSSLAPDDWTPLPLVAGNGSVSELRDPSPGSGQRFYRVREW